MEKLVLNVTENDPSKIEALEETVEDLTNKLRFAISAIRKARDNSPKGSVRDELDEAFYTLKWDV